MAIDEFEILDDMPRDLQYETLFFLVPSYDVSWDIEYFCEKPGEETKVYHLPCDLLCKNQKRWERMAKSIFWSNMVGEHQFLITYLT